MADFNTLTKFDALSDAELSEVNGGFWGVIASAGAALALDAWQHSDQILNGYNSAKKAYKNGTW